MSVAIEPRTITAEDYLRMPDDGRLTELVRGRIVDMNRPYISADAQCDS